MSTIPFETSNEPFDQIPDSIDGSVERAMQMLIRAPSNRDSYSVTTGIATNGTAAEALVSDYTFRSEPRSAATFTLDGALSHPCLKHSGLVLLTGYQLAFTESLLEQRSTVYLLERANTRSRKEASRKDEQLCKACPHPGFTAGVFTPFTQGRKS